MLQNGLLLEKVPRRGGEKQARGKRVRSAALRQPTSVSKHRRPHEDRAVCGARFTWIPASCNRSYSTHRGSIPVDSGLSLEYPQEPMEKSYDYSIKHLEKWKKKRKKKYYHSQAYLGDSRFWSGPLQLSKCHHKPSHMTFLVSHCI